MNAKHELIPERELFASHLVSTRAAITMLLERGEDPRSLHFRGMEALAEILSEKLRRLDAETLTHAGIEYAEMAGAA